MFMTLMIVHRYEVFVWPREGWMERYDHPGQTSDDMFTKTRSRVQTVILQ